jgi:hypothetical protein
MSVNIHPTTRHCIEENGTFQSKLIVGRLAIGGRIIFKMGLKNFDCEDVCVGFI